MRKSIHIIVGARPNYIKADPVYKALDGLNRYALKMINTGQHYDHNMSAVFFDQLHMQKPDINLEVGSGSHGVQTARILERYEKILLTDPPDLIMVFGDVNSTIACALAATKLHIPVAHVEAGLRSFDRTMPEEINRILTDRISDLLFITSPEARENLVNEGVDDKRIYFVGNTMIDSLVAFQTHFDRSDIHHRWRLENAYILMTFHRPSNVDDPRHLEQLGKSLERLTSDFDCVFPVHPRTRQKMESLGLWQRLHANDRFHLVEPLGYVDFMRLQRDATLVLTDSGGIQEESTYFGVPCLTVRDNTERPVTVTQGTNHLIGTDYSRIPVEVRNTLDGKSSTNQVPDLWDGQAAKRLADVLVKVL